MTIKPLLDVQNLTIDLLPEQNSGSAKALVKHANFKINAGEILALVGGSGSGKSITSLAIMRLLPDALAVRSGAVLLDGNDLFALTE